MSCKTLQYRYKTYAYKREAKETPTTFMRKAGLQLVVQPLRYNYRYLNQKELNLVVPLFLFFSGEVKGNIIDSYDEQLFSYHQNWCYNCRLGYLFRILQNCFTVNFVSLIFHNHFIKSCMKIKCELKTCHTSIIG